MSQLERGFLKGFMNWGIFGLRNLEFVFSIILNFFLVLSRGCSRNCLWEERVELVGQVTPPGVT